MSDIETTLLRSRPSSEFPLHLADAEAGAVRASRCESVSEERWRQLRARVRGEHRHLTASWYEAWARSLALSGRWRGPVRTWVATGSGGETLGVMPLATVRVASVDVLALGGYRAPFRSLPVADERRREVCRALAEAISSGEDAACLRLGPVEDNDAVLHGLLRELTRLGWMVHDRLSARAYLAAVPPDIARAMDRLGKRFRKHLAYSERRMRQEGPVAIKVVQDASPGAWQSAIRELGAIERRAWPPARGAELRFSTAADLEFWSALLSDPEASQAARAWILYFKCAPVGFCFTLDAGPCRYLLASGADRAVASYLPVASLCTAVIADAIERKIQLLHVGTGDAGLGGRWGARPERALREYVAFRPGLRGAGMFSAVTLAGAAREIHRAWSAQRGT